MDIADRIRTLRRSRLSNAAIAAILNMDIEEVTSSRLGEVVPYALPVPSAIYTAVLQGVTSDNADDVVVEWDAAPTYDPDTFDLTPEQSIRVKRSGVYRIAFFGEVGSMSNDDFWGLRVDEDFGDYLDLRVWAWTSFDRLGGDNHKRGAAMHMETVFAVTAEAVLPVVLDFSVQSSPPEALPTTYLTAFPQRLGDAPDLSGDGYYLPV